jgi:anaerobic magnesium-protoporphyrin IX monomethyl ester cyclase
MPEMSVLLIRPQTPDTSRTGLVSVQYPINIGYLVSYLKKNSINCLVRDYEVENFSEPEFIEYIRKTKPTLAGFSCMTPHILHAARMASIIKSNFPDIKTVAGGVHPSAIPEQTLREFSQFDMVIAGEGERTLAQLYNKITSSGSLNDVEGLVFRNNNGIIINPKRPLIEDLDEVPFPDRNVVNFDYYKRSHVSKGFSRSVIKIAEMISARGCPYNCIFCASKVVHSNKVRFRSHANIIAEIEELVDKYKIEHLSFLDDTFTIKQDILEPVCNFIKEKKLTFDCFTRVNDIDEEKIRLMVKSGCKKISFGIESGSPKVLKLLKKGITLPQIKEAFRLCRKSGLSKLEGTFMVGSHPDETLEDIEMTKKLIFQLQPDIMGVFVTIPFPGTEFNRILKERKFLLNENWEEFSLLFGKPSWKSGEVSSEDLKKIVENIIYKYYSNPLLLVMNLMKIRSWKELKYWFSLGVSFIKARKVLR